MGHFYYIGTDIGTSSAKTVLVNEHGHILGESSEAYAVLCPQNVWAEQWPDVWETAARNTIRQAIQKSGVERGKIAGLCISGLYGGSGIPLNEDMQPIRPCIIWMDRRTEALCKKISNKAPLDSLFSITENGVDSYFGFTKMLWIKENEPENWARTHLFLTPNQYVIYQLTGEAVIDRTSAGNLGGLFDVARNDWSDELLNQFEIPRKILPQRILAPYEIAGRLTSVAAANLGLPEGLPVCTGCIDCLSSTLAAGVVQTGQRVAVLATSLNLGWLHNDLPTDSRYISMPYLTNDHSVRYTYGGISTAGALTRWFSETFAPGFSRKGIRSPIPFAELEAAATEISAGSEGLLALPYFMGERSPIWDSKARGTIMGLTIKHSAAHIYRALLESVGYAMRHVSEHSDSGTHGACRLVGGGSTSKLWVQILADVTGMTMECASKESEAPLGDAFLAGLATGAFNGFEEIEKWTHPPTVFHPNPNRHDLYSKYFQIYQQLYPSVQKEMQALSDLAIYNK